jgi:hypothetical protein
MSGRAIALGRAVIWLCAAEGPRLDGEQAALDLIGEAYGSGATLIAVPVARLAPGFLMLSTRMAGGAIQKFVNYGFRVAFLGDISGPLAQSHALRDFVRESNRGPHVWFLDDLDALAARLA